MKPKGANSGFQRRHWENSYGRIPKGWEFIPIGSLFEERREHSADRKSYPLYSFTIEDGVTPKTERYERGFLLKDKNNNQFSVVHPGDFVFNPMNLRYGAISYSKVKFPVLVSGYYCVLKPILDRCDRDFMGALFRSSRLLHLYDRIAVGSLIEKRRVHLSILNRTSIPLPSLNEQVTIGKKLRAWDQAIEITLRLIDLKSQLKKGLMQQLLMGKRAPANSKNQWREYRLGQVFRERKEINRADLPLLSLTGEQGLIPHSENGRKDSSAEDKSKYKRIVSGDIGYNTMRMWQGVSALSNLEGIISPAYTVCIPKENVYAPFARHLFKFPAMVHRFYRYSQGLVGDTLNLKFPSFAQVKVTLPSIESQKKIAAVLDAVDIEINSLSMMVDKFKEQKRGLMQKLLSGQVKVKP